MQLLQNIIQELDTFIFPKHCCICGELSETHTELCAICRPLLPWFESGCYRCGIRIEGHDQSVYCETCQRKPPAYDRLSAVFTYEPPINQLIRGLKFSRQLAFGRILGTLLSEKIYNEWYAQKPLPQAIIPVPLHYSRLQKRGYNQALEILRPVLKDHDIPVLPDICERHRATRAQSKLQKNSRRNNLNHAFRIRKPIGYKHVAIVDDVVTTGSTVNAIAQALKNSNVEQVDIWCICRA